MTVDRCVCFNVRFETLRAVARTTSADTIPALQEEVEFGHNCEKCHPYVRRMLKTGQTTFSEIIGEDGGNSRSSTKPNL